MRTISPPRPSGPAWAFASIAILLGLSPKTAAAEGPAEAYAAAQSSYRQLKSASEEKRRFRHTWQDTIDQFKAVAERYPKSGFADDALYNVGTLYSELYDVSRLRTDLESAVGSFRTLSAEHASSNYADDALFWEAKALHLLNKHEAEVTALTSLIERYPKGDMVNDARRQLALEPRTARASRSSGASPEAARASRSSGASPEPPGSGSTTPATATNSMGGGAAPKVAAPEAAAKPRPRSGGEVSSEVQSLTAVKHWSNEGYTRVAIYAGGSVGWTAHELPADGDKPPRIYLDLSRARVGEGLKGQAPKLDNAWEIPIGDGLLQRARVAQFGPEVVRVVLDVGSVDRYEIVQLDDPFRIIVDVNAKSAPSRSPAAHATAAPTPEESGSASAELLEKRAERLADDPGGFGLFEQLGVKFGRIYVDAGHGGHDPGAIGVHGLREKVVTLSIAKKLKKKLIDLGYDAVLTRSDDTFLALEERSAIANEGKGDLFVSIHCNSTEGRTSTSAIETYYADAASDAASARLSAIENATSPQKMSNLESILAGLIRGEYTRMSAELADSVQRKLHREVKRFNPSVKDHGVKSALFYVLLTAQMPAILVETSFISNPRDEKRLSDEKYQLAVADSVAQGVAAYLDSRAGSVEPPTAGAKRKTASSKGP